jgi:dienelactone hydrolase
MPRVTTLLVCLLLAPSLLPAEPREPLLKPNASVADWSARRTKIIAAAERVMGPLPGPTFRVPLDTKTLSEERRGTILYRKLSYQSDPTDRATAWLLLPEIKPGERRPAILALHQTVRPGKDEPVGLSGSPTMQYGIELARRGYVVLAPDYPSFGEHTYDFTAHPEYASGTMKAIWDNIRGVDLLATLPEVDPARIGVIGHSLGGHNAIFTALFEPRLQVVVSSCGFTSLRKDDLPSWTGRNYMPRIATEFQNDIAKMPFDFDELVAALAPRPFLAVAATRDDDFDVTGVQDVIAAAKPVYTLYNREAALTALYPESPHDFPDAARTRAYDFLDQHLRPR